MPKSEYHIHTLSNGLRLVHRPVNSPVAHLGLIINTGSRDEHADEHGLAHLIEHMLFKGTARRKAYYILSRMEDVGGELNAYTTKEETCIHGTFFNQYYARAMELISDIGFHSSFPESEIRKEREIIFDEINSYKDSPELILMSLKNYIDGNYWPAIFLATGGTEIITLTGYGILSAELLQLTEWLFSVGKIEFESWSDYSRPIFLLPARSLIMGSSYIPLQARSTCWSAIPSQHTASLGILPTGSTTTGGWPCTC
jgi:hypothetical protein